MGVTYNTQAASASNQEAELAILTSIIQQLGSLATASGQTTLNTTLTALKNLVSTSANQATMISSLASSLTSLATLNTSVQTLNTSIQTLIGRFYSNTAAITVSSAIPISTSVKILSANANRKGLLIYNNSANSIYVAFGSAASSANNMTQIIATFTAFALPTPVYTGDIYATRNSGSGSALITELT